MGHGVGRLGPVGIWAGLVGRWLGRVVQRGGGGVFPFFLFFIYLLFCFKSV